MIDYLLCKHLYLVKEQLVIVVAVATEQGEEKGGLKGKLYFALAYLEEK